MYREDKLNEVLEKFPHMYNIDIGSNNEFLVYTLLEEIKQLNKSIYDFSDMLNIEKATNIWLERLGNIFGVYRENLENDNSYRIRILSFWLSVSKNATLEIMIKFLILAIEKEENLYKYDKGNGVIHIILNKRLDLNLRETIEKILLDIKAVGVNLIIEFKYKIQVGYLGCNLFQCWQPHIWKFEEKLVDKLNETKVEETNLTKLNVESLFMR